MDITELPTSTLDYPMASSLVVMLDANSARVVIESICFAETG
jgi:hypothetical protein